jgi:hypothetical protein
MRKVLTVGIVTLLAPSGAEALDYYVNADYTGEYTSNARRVGSGGEEDIIHYPAIRAGASQIWDRGSLDGAYSIGKRYYQDDTFEDDTVRTGYGSFEWEVVPRYLTFQSTAARSERKREPALPETPENRQEVQRVDGALILSVPVGRNSASASYRYDRYETEQLLNDSTTETVGAAFNYVVSSNKNVTFTIEKADSEFDEDFVDIESTRGAVGYASDGTRLLFAGQLGYAVAERVGFDDVRSVTFNVDANYDLGADRFLSFSAARLQDHRGDFRTLQPGLDPGFNPDIDFDSADVFVLTRASVGYSFAYSGNVIGIDASWSEQDFSVDGRPTNEYLGAGISLDRQLGSRTRMGVSAAVRSNQKNELNDSSERYRLGGGIDWTATSRVTVGLHAEYEERSGGTAAFDDWSVLLDVSVRLLGR